MDLPQPLIKGTLIKRYKRFLCDVLLENNEIITSHCPNSGSMLSIINTDSKVYLSKVINKKTKLKYKLELISKNNTLIGVNTLRANEIIFEALINKKIPELNAYKFTKKEAIFENNCRFDFVLYNNFLNNINDQCFIEVKSVTLQRYNALAEFPDAITKRGQKHADMLVKAIKKGAKAYIIYLIQRDDCNIFSIAKDIDISYYNKINLAISQGVKVLCYNCNITYKSITLNKPITIVI